MRAILKSGLIAASLTALMAVCATSASAIPTPTACLNDNILNTGTTTCSADGLTFTFQSPAWSPTSTGDNLSITKVSTNGGDVVLRFTVNPGVDGFPVDVLLDYSVTSGTADIIGTDASFPGETSGHIDETVCAVAFDANGDCLPSPLGGFDLTTGNTNDSDTFGAKSTIYVQKDVDAISFSDFTDSVDLKTVPEPLTLSLFGAGLVGAAALRRRKKA